MKKDYFQLDKVRAITLTHERLTTYKWFAEVPAKPKMFLGIQYGMTEVIPAGWSEYEDGRYRKSSSYFDDYTWYRVDEVNGKVYHKAHVNVHLGYKEGIGCNFDSTEEAQQWVDELVASSDKKFAVIIHK